MQANAPDWFTISNIDEVPSPSLLVYSERVEENIRRMITMAGGVVRLRPHMKTHKMREIIRLQMAQGIAKFKCATIAEAEMTAACGAKDVLLAYQPVGPNATRAVQLVQQYPNTSFAVLGDDEGALRNLSEVFVHAKSKVSVLLDIDCGQHRCGVEPGKPAIALYQLIASLPGVTPGGLHAYDGHIHDTDLTVRTQNCEAAFAPVTRLRQDLSAPGLSVPRVVAGGTPTFPMHAKRTDVECSPGTCVFWDFGYADMLPDMDFLVAALVLTRVVSKPGGNLLCLDLGHKAIAAENPQPRVRLLGLEDAQFVAHNEEHLVVETPRAAGFKVGDALYGIPRHICPTVALHSQATVIRDGRAVEHWKVAARDRRLTI